MTKPETPTAGSPASRIDARIAELGDWRGTTLARMRALIKDALPDVVEDWKWRGVPVWYHNGMICTGESYKAAVKLTFAKGASLEDPARLFNASLEGNARRAIDLFEGDAIDATAFKALVTAAAALNTKAPAAKKAAAKNPTAKQPAAKKLTATKPTATKPTAKKATARKSSATTPVGRSAKPSK